MRSENWVDDNGKPIGEPDRDIDEECAKTKPESEVRSHGIFSIITYELILTYFTSATVVLINAIMVILLAIPTTMLNVMSSCLPI